MIIEFSSCTMSVSCIASGSFVQAAQELCGSCTLSTRPCYIKQSSYHQGTPACCMLMAMRTTAVHTIQLCSRSVALHAAPAGEAQTHISALRMLSLCHQTTFVPSDFQHCYAAAVHLQVGVVVIFNAEHAPFKMQLDMHRRPQQMSV